MMGTTLQELDEVPDDKVPLHSQASSGEAQWPPIPPVHPRARDIHLRSLEVEVVCHRANRHKLGDKGLIVLDPRGWQTE